MSSTSSLERHGVPSAATALIDNGQLGMVLEGWSVPALPLYAMWPRRRDRSARLYAFVEWATELLSRAG